MPLAAVCVAGAPLLQLYGQRLGPNSTEWFRVVGHGFCATVLFVAMDIFYFALLQQNMLWLGMG